jgi:hypothetical protein
MTRLSRASGMRYHSFKRVPIRAQIGPFSSRLAELEHPYQHPYAVAPAAAMADDRHKMWRRPVARH